MNKQTTAVQFQTSSNKSGSKLKLSMLMCAGAILTLTACDGTKRVPENRRVRQAPMSQETTGVIVSGPSESEMVDALEKNADLTVRLVNPKHNLYEVYGASTSKLKTLFPQSIVEKNKYVDLKEKLLSFEKENESELTQLDNSLGRKQKLADSASELTENIKLEDKFRIPTLPKFKAGDNNMIFGHPYINAIKSSQRVDLSGDLRTFVESCKLTQTSQPKMSIKSSIAITKASNGLIVELGQTLALDVTQTLSNSTKSELEYLWVLTGPSDSNIAPRASMKPVVAVSPDTTGLHIFSVIAKNSDSVCNMFMSGYYVTANTPFAIGSVFDDKLAETLDPATFWHVFHVGSYATAKTANGKGIVVGIIDSGVDYNHPALASNIRVNDKEIDGNKIDDDNNGFVDDVVGYDFGLDDASPYDDYGHGTHVAGIAASNVLGAARKAKILATKFGAGFGFDVASVVGAIKYSVDTGAKVLNMSFGWQEDYEVMFDAMAYAKEKNVLIVAAAGNDGLSNDSVASFPCNYELDNIISVASSNEKNELVEYSNFGKKVHLAAPGGSPEKLIISASKTNPKKNLFTGMMGTSMASPLVAGVAAQVWSANPNLKANQVRQILLDTGKESEGLKSLYVSRVLNAEAAVARAVASK
jgi:subtilisin family serine protease